MMRHPAAVVAFLTLAMLSFFLLGDARALDGSGQPALSAHAPVQGVLETADAVSGLVRDRASGLKTRHGDTQSASVGDSDKAHIQAQRELWLDARTHTPRGAAPVGARVQSLQRNHFATGPPRV